MPAPCPTASPAASLYVALIVGTVLNLINQGDALLGPASVNWLKVVLTYCVPYAVCTYGAVSQALSARPARGPPTDRSDRIR